MRLRIYGFPITRIRRLITINRKKIIEVIGRAQKNSLRAFVKAFMNHKSMENTAFRIFIIKLSTVFKTIETSEIIN